MKMFTTVEQIGSVTFQAITPLDARTVRAIFSVRLPDYNTKLTDSLLRAYCKLAMRKTRTKNDDEIDAYIRSNGLLFRVYSSGGYVHFECTSEVAYCKKGIDLIAEILQGTSFGSSLIQSTKSLLKEENREARDDARRIADIAFNNSLYPVGSPYRLRTLDEESRDLRAITGANIALLRKTLLRGQWFVSVVGNETAVKHVRSFARTLSRQSRCVERPFVDAHIHPSTSTYITVPGKTNVEIRIGNRLPFSNNDAAFVPLSFGLAVLGKVGGFSGRLMSTVREREGLTYGIYARIVAPSREVTGHWNIFSFFTARDLKKGIDATIRELRKIASKGITVRELSVFKEILSNQFTIAHESNAARLALYHGYLMRGESEKHLRDEMKTIAFLTKRAVDSALKTYLVPDRLIIAGAGPVTNEGLGITTSTQQ